MSTGDLDFFPENVVAEPILPELPPTLWRSAGRRFNYATWPDRDRFVELDEAIVARQTHEKTNPERVRNAGTADTNNHQMVWAEYHAMLVSAA